MNVNCLIEERAKKIGEQFFPKNARKRKKLEKTVNELGLELIDKFNVFKNLHFDLMNRINGHANYSVKAGTLNVATISETKTSNKNNKYEIKYLIPTFKKPRTITTDYEDAVQLVRGVYAGFLTELMRDE